MLRGEHSGTTRHLFTELLKNIPDRSLARPPDAVPEQVSGQTSRSTLSPDGRKYSKRIRGPREARGSERVGSGGPDAVSFSW